MLSSTQLKEIVSEVRPIVERQLDDAERIAGFRDHVAEHGGDWSALKALIKAQVQDERDEAGDGKRVRKILDKAEFSSGYADMLGWSNMNEQNFSSGEDHDPETGEITEGGAQYAHPSTEPQRPPAAQSHPDTSPAASEPDGRSGDESPVTHSPETVERDEPVAAVETAGDYLREPVATEQGQIIREGDAPRETGRDFSGVASRPDAESQSSDLHDGRLQAVSAPALDESGAGAAGVEAPAASVIPFHPEETREQRAARLRPFCQNLSACAGSGRDHCYSCTKAMRDGSGDAA